MRSYKSAPQLPPHWYNLTYLPESGRSRDQLLPGSFRSGGRAKVRAWVRGCLVPSSLGNRKILPQISKIVLNINSCAVSQVRD